MLVSSVTRCTLSDAVCGFPARPAERRPLCSQRLDRVRARRRGCPARGVPQALYVRRASSASSSTVLPAVCAFARSSANSSSETWMLFWFSIARSLSGNPSAPNRRPPSSAVSALVLSLTAPLLCAYLRVSAPPRQNHSLRFPIPFHHDPVRGIGPSLRPVALRGAHSARASAFSRSWYPPAAPLRPILPDSCERNTWRIHRRPESDEEDQ